MSEKDSNDLESGNGKKGRGNTDTASMDDRSSANLLDDNQMQSSGKVPKKVGN